jgi:hypothetical protein
LDESGAPEAILFLLFSPPFKLPKKLGEHMAPKLWSFLFIWSAVAYGGIIIDAPRSDSTGEEWAAVEPSLPDAVPVQAAPPDPFAVTEKASMGIELTRSTVVEAPVEPGPLIPAQVWVSVGLMIASFAAYLWVATVDSK